MEVIPMEKARYYRAFSIGDRVHRAGLGESKAEE